MAILRSYRRFVVVARYFLPLLIAYLRDRNRFIIFGSSRSPDSETRERRAEHLVDSLVTLGPTFIKLGQLLSTRPDVLPPEYVSVLSQLQDDVPPEPWPETKKVIEEELGPLNEQFDDFNTEAISGASLGQVYKAHVDGEPVAVKVRRPGVQSLVEADLRVIKWSIPILVRFLDESRAYSIRNLADEFDKTIREEMDYERERKVLEEVRSNFEDSSEIVVPRSYEQHSGKRVLTMEYIDGIKIDNYQELERKGINQSELAERLQRAYMQMVVIDGTFHADPHPGNLAVQDDGTLVFYDFGMSGRVDQRTREQIIDFYIAVANQDIDKILDTWIELGALSPNADRELMSDIIEIAIQNARGGDIEQYRVQEIVDQMEDTLYEFPFRIPRDLALVLRVATVVEGVCVRLDRNFDFIDVATDYLSDQGYREQTARRLATEFRSQITDVGRSAFQTLPKFERTLDRIERENLRVQAELEDPQSLLDTLAKRLIYGMLAVTGILSGVFLYTFQSTEAALIAFGGAVITLFLLRRSLKSDDTIAMQTEFAEQSFEYRQGASDLGIGGDVQIPDEEQPDEDNEGKNKEE
ncbi:AarF/ABC1/UbiB kinase family protein [Salinarchaeum sp. IM2453]|uniref:ABC1 kinase family protein n=1 Tax=Salinarchaeum sp. IM2453 TaxID=2862870 RepID=UPI0021065C66|nr:AarF/ABC1/UbiB kinase family protein [Salinarchaeum sp. IM2453]